MMNTLQELDVKNELALDYKDGVTNLYGHSLFQIAVDYEIKRSERYGKEFCLALIDADRFSFYNEKNGYAQGDLILKRIAEAIEISIRKADIVARYAGDQFVIIFTETNIADGLKISERTRKAIYEATDEKLTVSIGVVNYPNDGKSRPSLISKAHKTLSEAKIKGGNIVYYFDNKTISSKKNQSILSNVLVVDDNLINLKVFQAMLATEGYQIILADNGSDALHCVEKHSIDLILLDVMMPGIDGYEVCQRLKTNEKTRLIPIILITALDDAPSKIKGIEAGADDFITKPPNKVELLARVKSLIKFNNLNKNLADVKNILISIATAVEAKDSYTQGHVERVANFSVAIGKKFGLSDKEIEALWFAGILHDVGKIGIPDIVLNKNGKLNDNEWEIIKKHPTIGYKICLPLNNNLGLALEGILHHHERLDGSGYPDGIKGDLIPEIARIVAVVDLYDALVTDRPYRKGMDNEKALSIINDEAVSGKLDARVAKALFEVVSS
ncbi:MAG: diguanylate cyclase [Gammaproteobacteria bacterium]|nr:diguanylate cyclase [Gammaproteobacteria bacterium]